MSKTKSTIILIIVSILILGLAFLTFVPLNNGELGIYDWDSISGYIKFGFDLEGGVYVVYDVTALDEGEVVTDANVNATVLRLQTILQDKGYNEGTVTIQTDTNGAKRIRVEVPDVSDPQELFDLLGNPADMVFVAGGHEEDYESNSDYILLTGEDVETAGVTYQDGKYGVGLQFNASGTEKFANATKAIANGSAGYSTISIIVDGNTVSTATVTEAIVGGSAVISRDTNPFTYEEANDLAMRIASGAFNVKLKTYSSGEVSATLGDSAMNQALIAGGIGLAIVMIFMVIVYRKLGLVADIALIIYVLLYMVALAILPFMQLTLPGIAGIILSIGMAVDANIIIFERMRDEYASNPGKSLENTIFPQGFKKSYAAIIDGNVTTVLGAIVLWIAGTGAIVGFAMTLLVGVVLSFITSVFITRGILNLFVPFDRKNARAYGLATRKGVDL
ncbi:MAG: preprotein translocase subunit SecD [Clostridia bacterium]|nr:preprotein translocase subunit SecD [Clostridia bacterium]